MDGPGVTEGFGLLPALRRLDALLGRAMDTAAVVYGPQAATDPYRGLAIGPDEVDRLLSRGPGEPLFGADAPAADGPDDDRGNELAWLGRTFGLTPLDLDLLVIAAAPELDLRYERLYAYLQDDVTRRRPSVDLALNLLCPSAAARLTARGRVAADAPLVRHGLLHLLPDPNQPHQPLLSQAMKVDEQILHLLIGQSVLDSRLARCARFVQPRGSLAALPLDPETLRALPRPADGAGPGSALPRLYFMGPADTVQLSVAEALAAERGLPLLVTELERAAGAAAPLEEVVRIAFREAWLRRGAIFVSGVDALDGGSASGAYDRLVQEVAAGRVLTVLAGRKPWAPPTHRPGDPAGVAVVPFPVPAAGTRRAWWRRELEARGVTAGDRAVERLSGQYRLPVWRIREAVATARNRAEWTGARPQDEDLLAAARAQCGRELASLSRKVEPGYAWDALILPEEVLTQLRELCDQVAHRQRVLEQWGFGRVLALGRGVCALFVGPSGTGKTMAADVLAGELGLDLYKIDLATVVSKYIGETEKNLERIFEAAESANAVLFFDEADAIFGKRSEVRDAHDRYANLEVAYLLQRMESYDGIAILATNLRENLDSAFLRRLHFIVEFPMPTERYRERMWRQFMPAGAPVNDTVDFAFLAGRFRLSGGNIKNIVLSSAYRACADGGRIGMAHLVRATWREHQKIGRVLSEDDMGEYAALLAEDSRDEPLGAER
ncbi:ATP-binding protein [Wenjunlia tyrosinilytica]|uniref:ATPase AAA n=1 Tax=Wenjunlia tyrosinilytica TaxID=1544741 RepID=A0A917ZUM1_9ACTN|nr:ATP-binding protein [Wenjunlia tyrosinilytica]GGO94479.1 ATPase AAA [Wenjunlia tyrosinilytica]